MNLNKPLPWAGTFILCVLMAYTACSESKPEIQWMRGSHANTISSVAYASDIFASASVSDNGIKLWRVSDQSFYRTLVGHSNGVTCLAFSTNGTILASGGGTSFLNTNLAAVCIWHMPDGQLQRVIPNPVSGIASMVMAPDGSWVGFAVGTAINLYNTADGSFLRALTNQAGTYGPLALSPDGSQLASISGNTITLWRTDDGTYTNWNTLPGKLLAFSPDGQKLLMGGGSGRAYMVLYSVADHQLLWQNLNVFASDISGIAFSPDGGTIASGGWYNGGSPYDPSLKLWRTSDGTLLRNMQTTDYAAYSVAFSPDGTKVLSGGKLGNGGPNETVIRLWQVANGALLNTPSGPYNSVTTMVFSPNGTMLGSGASGLDRSVRIWKTSDGTQLRLLSGLVGNATGIAFSSDNLNVVACDDWTSPYVRCWRISDGAQLWQQTTYPSPMNCLAASPVSNVLAIGVSSRIELRRFTDGETNLVLTDHTGIVTAVAFSPVTNILASGSVDKTVKLWQFSSTNAMRTIEVGAGVKSVAFSPDGNLLTVGSSDATVQIWRVADGALQRTLVGHQGAVLSAEFSPDGETIVSIGMDGTARIWRVSDGVLLRTYDSEILKPISLAVSPVNRLFAYGRADTALALARFPSFLRPLPSAGGNVQLQMYGTIGQTYTLETSTNLVDWLSWKDITPTSRITLVSHPTPESGAPMYYRAKIQ